MARHLGERSRVVTQDLYRLYRFQPANTDMSESTPPSDPIAQITEDLTAAIAQWGDAATQAITQSLAQTTAETGEFLEAVAENPLVQAVTGLPVLDRLPTFLGEVNRDRARAEVARLQAALPQATPAEIADRIIVDTALQAAGVGLVTNIVPPIALTLFAVDLAAVTQLQVEMLYRIAAAYDFPLEDARRRGEVLAIFGLSLGGSGVLKAGLGFVEIVPGVGAVVGASTNAILIYSLGYTACRYYEARRDAAGDRDSLLPASSEYLQRAAARQIVLDQLLAHVVLANNPKLTWAELSPQLQRLALTPLIMMLGLPFSAPTPTASTSAIAHKASRPSKLVGNSKPASFGSVACRIASIPMRKKGSRSCPKRSGVLSFGF